MPIRGRPAAGQTPFRPPAAPAIEEQPPQQRARSPRLASWPATAWVGEGQRPGVAGPGELAWARAAARPWVPPPSQAFRRGAAQVLRRYPGAAWATATAAAGQPAVRLRSSAVQAPAEKESRRPRRVRPMAERQVPKQPPAPARIPPRQSHPARKSEARSGGAGPGPRTAPVRVSAPRLIMRQPAGGRFPMSITAPVVREPVPSAFPPLATVTPGFVHPPPPVSKTVTSAWAFARTLRLEVHRRGRQAPPGELKTQVIPTALAARAMVWRMRAALAAAAPRAGPHDMCGLSECGRGRLPARSPMRRSARP